MRLALPDFPYRAVSPEGVVEHEVCPVFVAEVDADPVPDPERGGAVAVGGLVRLPGPGARQPWALSPWSVEQAALLPLPVRAPAAGE